MAAYQNETCDTLPVAGLSQKLTVNRVMLLTGEGRTFHLRPSEMQQKCLCGRRIAIGVCLSALSRTNLLVSTFSNVAFPKYVSEIRLGFAVGPRRSRSFECWPPCSSSSDDPKEVAVLQQLRSRPKAKGHSRTNRQRPVSSKHVPGILYTLQGVRDHEAIRSASPQEAARAVTAAGIPVNKQEAVADTMAAGETLPYLPSAEEDLDAKIAKAEKEGTTLEQLSKAVQEKMMAEKYDIRIPYKPPKHKKASPWQLDLLSYYAKEALRGRDTPQAITLYQRCIDLDPYDGRAWVGLGRIEQKRQDNRAARIYYERACEFCSDNPFVLQAYGVFEQRSGHPRRAMDLYDAAIKYGPTHSASWLAKAQLLWELGRKREARACFQTAVQTNAENEVLWHAWGVAEKRDGNHGVARKLLRRATEINPRNSFCWHAWASMEQELRNLDVAVELYQNALKAFPNSSHSYQAWACLEKDRGDWTLAFKLFRLGIEKRPWDGGIYQPYALALKEKGNIAMAIEVFQKGIQEDPHHCPLYQAYGLLLNELGQVQEARAVFDEGTTRNPRGRHVYYIWHAWAVLEEKSGEIDTARAYFRNALNCQPRSIPTLVALAQLEEVEKNIEGCREMWERVLSIRPQAEIYWQAYIDTENRLGGSDHVRKIEQRRDVAFHGLGVVTERAGEERREQVEEGVSRLSRFLKTRFQDLYEAEVEEEEGWAEGHQTHSLQNEQNVGFGFAFARR